jgi:hypothetical protein
MTSRRHSGRYECPVHRCDCVLETHYLSPMGKELSGMNRVTFYRCPAIKPTGERCTFMRPNKWQRRPVTKRKTQKPATMPRFERDAEAINRRTGQISLDFNLDKYKNGLCQ